MIPCFIAITSLSFYLDVFQDLARHMSSAANYIANNIASASDPYAVAVASCALANAGQLDSDLLFKFASPGKPQNDHF